MTKLLLTPDRYREVLVHLFPSGRGTNFEQAAFLFCAEGTGRNESGMELHHVATYLTERSDFVARRSHYLEIDDAARAKVIKRAHDLRASLIEIHSHPSSWPAAFSREDRIGLLETVPHMKWRLPGRSYGALVFSYQDFDALVWLADESKPSGLAALIVGNEKIRPTNLSIGGW